MKKSTFLLILAALLLTFSGCEKDRVVHCDRCGAEIILDADSKIKEDWIVFCKDCEEPVIAP